MPSTDRAGKKTIDGVSAQGEPGSILIPAAMFACVVSLVAAAGLPIAALAKLFPWALPEFVSDGQVLYSWALGIGALGLVSAAGCLFLLLSTVRKLEINIP